MLILRVDPLVLFPRLIAFLSLLRFIIQSQKIVKLKERNVMSLKMLHWLTVLHTGYWLLASPLVDSTAHWLVVSSISPGWQYCTLVSYWGGVTQAWRKAGICWPSSVWFCSLPLLPTLDLTFPLERATTGLLPSSALLLVVISALGWDAGWDSSPLAQSEHYGKGPVLYPAEWSNVEGRTSRVLEARIPHIWTDASSFVTYYATQEPM